MNGIADQGELFGLVLQRRHHFRLRVNDLIRLQGRLGLIIRVSECSAVVLVNRRLRQFKTRFDKPVRIQPSPITYRISPNSETEILNRKARRKQQTTKQKGGHMKTYEGSRQGYAVIVTVNGRPLNPRLDLYNHSPTGFEWGYCGSGPAQLALAILADHLADDREALNLYQRFKWAVVVGLPRRRWILTSLIIDQILQNIRNQEAEGVIA